MHEVLDCLVPLPTSSSSVVEGGGDKVGVGEVERQEEEEEGDEGVAQESLSLKKPTDEDASGNLGEDNTTQPITGLTTATNKHDNTNNNDDDDEPAVITNFPLFKRNYPQTKPDQIGLPGLQYALLKVGSQLQDGLKRVGGHTKASRKDWEVSVYCICLYYMYSMCLFLYRVYMCMSLL